MKKQKIAFGPGAASLILIAVVLALSVLTVLTMISARNDEALSLRSTETRQEAYGLFAQAERSLAKLDAVPVSAGKENADAEAYLAAAAERLPEGMRMEDDQIFWEEKTENRILECAVRLTGPGENPRTRWTKHRLGEADIWEDDFGDDGFEDGFGDDSGEESDPEEEPAETGDGPEEEDPSGEENAE